MRKNTLKLINYIILLSLISSTKVLRQKHSFAQKRVPTICFETLKRHILFLFIILINIVILITFWLNRFDKDIIGYFLNTIIIGSAFTLLGMLSCSGKVRISFTLIKRLSYILFVIFLSAFVLSFYVNKDNNVYSKEMYLYLFVDRDDGKLYGYNLNLLHRVTTTVYNVIWESWSKDKSHPDQTTILRDFPPFMIFSGLSERFGASWLIKDNISPIESAFGWGPKYHQPPIATKKIKRYQIKGYGFVNSILNRKFKSMPNKLTFSQTISVPDDTEIGYSTNVVTPLSSSAGNKPDERASRITIKNNYCKITIDILFFHAMGWGDQVFRKEPMDIIFPGLQLNKLHPYVFKFKYSIEYTPWLIGTKYMLTYYKPWSEDLCSYISKNCDIENILNEFKSQKN
ncbi:MAG: hypothetical protein A2219_06475 [Elusimicrobia bacterium RIFOXYA2_FULL_50_26]|nr:MAG: hypothetical protein A2219_06475 [Elusimicrobia bacterium RIFOXYA2_FULL_50_26]OGS23833.1 MAG: hypothetical protein A2314_01760 [Elusimicrobia bacterium RIFOXYB2_FULL_50_12]